MILAGFIMMLGTLGIFYIYAHSLVNLDFEDIKKYPELSQMLSKAQTMAFCVLAFFQIWNTQNSRSLERSIFFNLPYPGGSHIDRIGIFSNPILIGVTLLAIGLQVSAVALPFMNHLLDTVPLNRDEWILVMSLTFSIIVILEIVKILTAVYNKLTGKLREDVNLEAIELLK